MIVVDTNIICYLYVPGHHKILIEKLILQDPDWVAPRLWISEFRNAMSGYLRHNIISFEEVAVIMSQAESFFHGRDFEVDSLEVLTLVERSTCSAYDCEFVALAQDLHVPLLTFDKKILRQFPNTAVSPHQFLAP